jgi:hypothetical protein
METLVSEQAAGNEPMKRQPSIIEQEYFTTSALAAMLDVSPRTLERWHALRLGPPRTTIGRLVLYRRDSVAEWLHSREDRARRANGHGRRGN